MDNMKSIQALYEVYCDSWNKEVMEQSDQLSTIIEGHVGRDTYMEKIDGLLSNCINTAELQGFQKGVECMIDLLKKY